MDNQYAAVVFKTERPEVLNLWLQPYEVLSIEEGEGVCVAYWSWTRWKSIKKVIESDREAKSMFPILEIKKIEQQNWNQKWEEGFQPIEVNQFCRVRASFHASIEGFDHEILIEPKMSFGTGHHATTWQMILMMKKLNFTGQNVLDYGCGTGILAILAAQMGANTIDAFDYDEWCFKNSIENAALNGIKNITWSVNTLDSFQSQITYDIILANINRNVLLDSITALEQLSHKNTFLLMSGFYRDDLKLLKERYKKHFEFLENTQKDNWICALWQRLE